VQAISALKDKVPTSLDTKFEVRQTAAAMQGGSRSRRGPAASSCKTATADFSASHLSERKEQHRNGQLPPTAPPLIGRCGLNQQPWRPARVFACAPPWTTFSSLPDNPSPSSIPPSLLPSTPCPSYTNPTPPAKDLRISVLLFAPSPFPKVLPLRFLSFLLFRRCDL